MGGACGTYGGEKRCILCFGRVVLSERNHMEDLGVVGKIILKIGL
jgi:hypothetical protein